MHIVLKSEYYFAPLVQYVQCDTLTLNVAVSHLKFWNLPQVDKEEVRLRRTVASKKDEYYLDGKHVRYVGLCPKPVKQCCILVLAQVRLLLFR